MMVPGGGLETLSPIIAKKLLLMRFFTTTTLSLGLQQADGEILTKPGNCDVELQFCELPNQYLQKGRTKKPKF